MRQASWTARAALFLLGALAAPVCAAAATLGSALQVGAEIAPSCQVSWPAPGMSPEPGSPGSEPGSSVSGPGTGVPTVALTCTKGVLAILAAPRPEERPVILRGYGARGSAVAAVDQRGAKSRMPSGRPFPAPLVTTINF
jgi:hypothetical protein